MADQDSEEFFSRLKEQLTDSTTWPSDYLYKFIVLSNKEKIERIHTIFDNTGAVIQLKKSKNGKYTSVSIMVNLSGPDEVIAKYKEVGAIEGVISL